MARQPRTGAADPRQQGERTRRAFARRRWARRWLGWRRALVALAVLVLLGVGSYAVYFSSWLALDRVEVVGVDHLTVEQVTRAAAAPEGDPLARVDVDAIRTRVAALSAVRSVDVTRAWPHAVRVEVTEREAVAVVDVGSGLRGLDEQGVLFRDYRTAPPGLPLVITSAGISREALTEAAGVVVALPVDLRPVVQDVRVGTVDEITLTLTEGRTVVWGSAEESEQKGEVLAVLLQQEAAVYDVSVPATPTTRDRLGDS